MLAKGTIWSKISNRFWVSSKVVPNNPLSTLGIDASRPIIYVLEQNSSSDLLALQKACQQTALPDPFQIITIADQVLSAVIYLHDNYWFKKAELKQQQSNYLNQYQQLFSLYRADNDLAVQLVPVTFFWGRNPGKQTSRQAFSGHTNISRWHKACLMMVAGRDHLIRFNPPISVSALIKDHRNTDSKQQAYQLARVALHYFRAQHRSTRGPAIPKRKKIIKQVLESEQLQQDIQQYSANTGMPETQVSEQCEAYLQEISSQFSYRLLRFFRIVLGRVWNGIYQGIEVNNAQAVRAATQSGAEIVYMPCHRSHMDYLLLSYLLFEEGLMPPHIAAGVNLNFFPAGGIFRRSGAFFLRRTFKDNPLYGKVFKAYFAMLFKQGYPIEFFTEGGRSRTGRLLPPKTGLLAMSIDTFLSQPQRNVVIVPIYIGYDHIMEVSTYMKELSGQHKKQENAWQVIGIVKKLGNFGRAFVNFGEPINLKHYFEQQVPTWREEKLSEGQVAQQVNQIATQVMQGINQATAVNALPLCAAILLASTHHQLGKQRLLTLIALHQQLLGWLSDNRLMTYPKEQAEHVYQQAFSLNKFSESQHVISCDTAQSAHLTYYRNTIVHLFALPSLLSFVLIKLSNKNNQLLRDAIEPLLARLLPYVEAEYFLAPASQPLVERVNLLLVHLQSVNMLRIKGDFIEISHLSYLKVLSAHLSETRLRYHCVLSLLVADFQQSNADLISASKIQLTEQSIEPFDQKVIEVFIRQLDRKSFTIDAAQQLLACLSDH
ncbi:glycerol-3-phosphate 1-O-acyltransferase PlsB [Psychromonas sp. B3M02]|uniref:glycerol-3-phosphate 1-O-acyltransferase PlsB n=1 Tax=Psychromonas sp. B3M02 TaxID=2267226 RepID=UPI0015F09BBD|nr:glycerol-3-phosphate 1-O-acyltransferase PlsB [Psychromonas sp. B3M02]